MKYIKFFYNYTQFEKNSYFLPIHVGPHWQFKDEYLGIHKILHGVNEGKIQFIFFNDKKNNFSDKYSLMSGSAMILDTKYVDNIEIRKIIIEPPLKKLFVNTKEYILNTFISTPPTSEKNIYDSIKEPIVLGNYLRNLIENLKIVLGYKLEKIATESNNLGEIFDKLKIFREDVIQFQKEHFEKWELDRDTKKYNL
jgi:hypothetical protein